MRQTKTIELPSGIKADIVTSWTYDDYLKIEAAAMRPMKSATMGADGIGATINIDASDMVTADLLAVTLGVKRLIGADGAEMAVNEQVIKELDWRDGTALRDAIKEMERESKKK